ncbi:putative Histidyl-tRNA synthetase [Glarea lozoyensis 74030]|uniref:Putative Histidyl-tRNA synthetase n=1 Tax=Glarea lozoyensis (strain ATCC 74030 / MF5533) TaxID=1104152 RepID=H0ECV7_GLAL7|nr:putative Histidyl-tRNA synthetase [Glarea lozoyensis 74030]
MSENERAVGIDETLGEGLSGYRVIEDDPNDTMVTKAEKKKATRFELKTPKGTKDWEGKDMVIRDKIFSTITDVFKRHGAVTIDTPVFELKEILSGKYGEDSKLIYDLADQAVDKLDKLPWAEVRKEMTEEKGLAEEVADKIGEYVVQKGQKDLLAKLQADEKLMANESMKAGLADMDLLFTYLEAFDALENVSFDLSLARGLDYYTGVIYEIVTEGSAPNSEPLATVSVAPAAPPKPSKKPSSGKSAVDFDEDRSSDPSVGVGSVAAGGRYDNLVGMFSGKTQIPCVGISFGVDRIFSVTKARMAEDNAEQVRNNETEVFVMAFGGKGFTGLLKERLSICTTLWEAGIKVSSFEDTTIMISSNITRRRNFFTKSSPSYQINSMPQKRMAAHYASLLARMRWLQEKLRSRRWVSEMATQRKRACW